MAGRAQSPGVRGRGVISSGPELDWLTRRLPPVRTMVRRCEADYYGASHLLARLLGLGEPPPSSATWTHAWQADPTTHPLQLLNEVREERRHLVATPAHERLLRGLGHDALAVGLPYVYADDVQAERIPGSLLVMPAHSLRSGDYDWNEEEYIEVVASLRDRFDPVVACLHSKCIERGRWVPALQAMGVPWILGADIVDANALTRMTTMLKSFEFVTTNRMASHLPYAAYSGCKVSIHGPYLAPVAENYVRHRFYKAHPEVLELNLARTSESAIRQRYGDFFLEPWRAVERRAWAAETLGAHCRKPVAELARELGWPATGLRAQLQRMGQWCRRPLTTRRARA